MFSQAAKYRVSYKEFLGSQPDEGTIKPQTTQSENWNCSAADELDCVLQWTETLNDIDIFQSKATDPDDDGDVDRAGADDGTVSTDDHFVEVVVTKLITPGSSSGTTRAGVCVRFAAAADTTYCARAVTDNTADE